jgi:hypothetical protein
MYTAFDNASVVILRTMYAESSASLDRLIGLIASDPSDRSSTPRSAVRAPPKAVLERREATFACDLRSH